MVETAPNAAVEDPWEVAGLALGSRVLLGTSRYPSLQTLLAALDASGAEVVTVAVRRVDLGAADDEASLLGALRARAAAGRPLHLLPNTAGCFTAREAVLTAQLAREALGTDLV
jgi:thiazole synthase